MMISSISKRFPGTIELPDTLTFQQVAAWRAAIDNLATKTVLEVADDDKAVIGILPVICQLIIRCDIAGIPEHPAPETWPATPRADAGLLIAQIVAAVTKFIVGADDPNE